MINGVNSSGLSLALRTANNARATMDKMTTQIATGKKVASVKDDGAAYVRAAAMKSDLAQIEGREALFSMYDNVVKAHTVQIDQSNAANQWMADVIMRAISYPAGSSARQQLAAEWTQAYDSWKAARAPQELTPTLAGLPTGGWGFVGTAQDALTNAAKIGSLNGTSFFDNGHQTIDFLGNGVPIQAVDILNGSTNHLTNGLATVKYHIPVTLNHTTNGGDAAFIGRAARISESQKNRIESAVSSLTDADLGDVSSARANAETKQQLAFTTISNALSHYGKVAGSLLGNVQNTQRGVMA